MSKADSLLVLAGLLAFALTVSMPSKAQIQGNVGMEIFVQQ
jgi:hypothetical protein